MFASRVIFFAPIVFLCHTSPVEAAGPNDGEQWDWQRPLSLTMPPNGASQRNGPIESRLVPSKDAGRAEFGVGVAIDGTTALVGAPGDDRGIENANVGAAYAYTLGDTGWQLQQKLVSPDGAVNDRLGLRVALDGDTAVIAAPFDNSPILDQGSVYVFVRSGGTWNLQQKLTAPDGAESDLFGTGVALNGDTLLVGAALGNGPTTDQGAAYFFTRNGAVWSFQQKITAQDGASFDQFGVAVSIDGGTALVAAVLDVDPPSGQGSVYAFVRNGLTWVFQQKLTSTSGSLSGNFGASVALRGDVALIGASGDDVGANQAQGSAYVLVRNGSVWLQQARLVAPDGFANERFGGAVAIANGIALVSARADVGGIEVQGAAYAFARNGSTWRFRQKLTSPAGESGDIFGHSVALSGDRALIGAPLEDSDPPPGAHRGAAYVLDLNYIFADGFEQ